MPKILIVKGKSGFWPKIRFCLKKSAKRLMFIWEKGTFSFAQLCPVVARTWLELRSGCFFLAPKIRILARKSIFSYGNLFFRTATWVAQVVTQILRPTDLVYDFSFPSYGRFREGTRPMPQKVFPHPTVRAPSASNSPSADHSWSCCTKSYTYTHLLSMYLQNTQKERSQRPLTTNLSIHLPVPSLENTQKERS